MLHTGIAALATAAVVGTLGGLPKGTLFMESHPPAMSGEAYEKSDSTGKALRLDPCDTGKAWDTGRVAVRTMVYTSDDDMDMKDEQLVLYKNVAYAERAMRQLRTRLARCAVVDKGYLRRSRLFTKPATAGDEALRAGRVNHETSFRYVAMRRGSTLYIVGETGRVSKSLPLKDFRGLVGEARKMAVRVCDVPGVDC
ncbi:hypothetical protein ABT120_40550 [Nonomuraea angiospora]|uniref:hypothetical protein n=1 Tax=Nonomuraea angiospora TaxID=46172 RepID=UPI003333DC7A